MIAKIIPIRLIYVNVGMEINFQNLLAKNIKDHSFKEHTSEVIQLSLLSKSKLPTF